MNGEVIYHVVSEMVNGLGLEVRLRRVLRDFTLGVVASRSCQLGEVAAALRERGEADSQYRRIQRFLSNEAVAVDKLQGEWAQQVLDRQGQSEAAVVLLVDETALHEHLKVMVVGMWAEGGCVPLAWRSYEPSAYPAEGQVRLITGLLDRILPAMPAQRPVWLLADRGIGTSPDLIQAVSQREAQVLFRVQGTTRFRDSSGQVKPLRELGKRGACWRSVGDVFKNANWLTAAVTVTWDEDYDQPWCLVSSQPVPYHAYAIRFDHEVSFRDLKSDGFQWQRSRVWLPDHADRLLLVLALAYWLVSAIAQRLPAPRSARQRRLSLFRRGLDALVSLCRPSILPFLPPSPFLTCVVH